MNVMLLVHRSDRKGTLEAKGVMGVDIITGTLGKAWEEPWVDIPLLKEVIELLRQRSRPIYFQIL
jgi:7-keto-8-aminopelargonate synthetase-like enzyme